MKPGYHVAASTVISAGLQASLHSWPAATACFLGGIFIDLDHQMEYLAIRRRIPWKIGDLVEFFDDHTVTKNYLVFHAYEYFIVLWTAIWYFHLGKVWTGLAVGLTTHVLFDQFTNYGKPLYYFLSYRIMNNFEKTKLLTPRYYQMMAERENHQP